MTTFQPTKLLTSLSLPFLAGLVGAQSTSQSLNTWYESLAKPFFNPPNWIFAPVWTFLYLLMGIALYRVWSDQPPVKVKANPEQMRLRQQIIALFVAHLALNAFWSVVFFGLQNPLSSLYLIIAMVIIVAFIVRQFYHLDKTAAYLLAPYLAWVAFATILNFSIWYLN